MAIKQYDESLINYFDEHLVSQADALYRVGFALTLSLDGAWTLVRKVYEEVAANLEKIRANDDLNVKRMLVTELWRAFKSLGDKDFREGKSAVTQGLKPLSPEARAALVMVDVAGLTGSEAAAALQIDEKTLRIRLAEARRTLMMSDLDY